MPVREARRADLEALLDQLERLNATGTEADPRYRIRSGARDFLREHHGETWFGRFQPFPACLVDERDGVLAGFVSGAPRQDHPVLDHPPTARIGELWVEPAYRRQGVARALVTAFRERCARAGYADVEVSTLARDARAVAFWRSVGFDDLRLVLLATPPAG